MRLKKLTLVSACIAGMFLTACGGGSGGGSSIGGSLPAVAELKSQAFYQIAFKDAITGNPITDRLSVTFKGDATLTAADGTSLNGKTITTTDGVVALGATFSMAAKDFSVQVGNRALGWVETGTSVTGSSLTSGDHTLELLLLNTSNATAINDSTAPISVKTGTSTVTAGGALGTAVSLSTTPKTVTNAEGAAETTGSATLKLPVGVVGKTASGQPAAAGSLTVAVINYSNSNVDSLSAFPGGFAATVSGAPASALNGAAADGGSFVTGGFAQFNVTDSAGNAIKNFDPPIPVSIDLPKTTLAADGATLLKVGDAYPIWSYDDATGGWKFEKEGTVAEKTPVDPNNYTVAFTTSHLSSWNLDFYVASCTGQINLTGRPAGDTRQLDVEVTGVSGRRFSYRDNVTDSQLSLLRSPIGTAVNVVVKNQGVIVGRVSNQHLCTGSSTNPISIPLTLQATPVGTVRVETSESCTDGSQKRAVPAFTYLMNGTSRLGGYTVGTTVASKNFASILPGTKQVYVQNPRTLAYTSKPVSVTANSTVTAAFNFPVTCPTGATGATGAGN